MNSDELATQEADAVRDGVDDLMGRYAGDVHEPDCSNQDGEDWCPCQESAREELDERPLELVAQKGSPYEIVLGVGGPDSRIVWDGRYGTTSARLEVNWGSGDVIRRSDGIRAMAAYFGDLMDLDD